MPASARLRSTTAGGAVTRMPSASYTSAPPAVLGHADAARRDDERRTRRNIERARAVAAGAAVVEYIVVAPRDLHGVCAHRARQPDDLRRTLPLHHEAVQQSGDVRRRCASF